MMEVCFMLFITQIAIALEWSFCVMEILRMHSMSLSHGQRGQMYHIHICWEKMMRSKQYNIGIALSYPGPSLVICWPSTNQKDIF